MMTDHRSRFRLKSSRSDLSERLRHSKVTTQGWHPITQSGHEHRVLSSILNIWTSRSTPLPRVTPTVTSTHTDLSKESGNEDGLISSSPASHPLSLTSRLSQNNLSPSPKLPRHVPIIIPDFAQPYAPKSFASTQHQRFAVSSPSPQNHHSIGGLSLSNARLRPGARSEEHLNTKLKRSLDGSQAIMNSSEVSLSASESGADQSADSAPPLQSLSSPTAGIVSPISQSGSGGANLSGLVCNVHKTTGQEAPPLVGATTTILGDKLYVFGGRIHSRSRPQLTSDMYELDLIRRHWTRIDTVGDIPPPRYFHSVCALGDSKLVCYGGMSPAPHLRNPQNKHQQHPPPDAQPEVVVMSDIHIYDVPTRKWHLVAASSTSSDAPQGRYAHCAAILPSSAVFTSANAPHSAIHHNRPSSEPHSGTLGVQLDGAGGAEMLVVGGQDSANNYIEQISVFNLRSLKWTSITEYDRKCGAYKSMVAPLVGLNAEDLGRGLPLDDPSKPQAGTSMLIYSNYNFLDVKLELQIRLPDGTILERQMAQGESPPGLRFPNGGIINSHFVVSGTYLTSSKHEYALWALDLRTLTWHRIDTAGSVFSTGSWNRGMLWNRRNQFVILGHRKRNLVDDYNHRRINFAHVCMVELEAFGLYDNPRKMSPTSSYISKSSPAIPTSLYSNLGTNNAGGRQLSNIAEQLGQTALAIAELSDMELVALGGERIACNSQVLAKRWGPYFSQLLEEAAASAADSSTLSDATTLRATMNSQASRASTVTITPTGMGGISPIGGTIISEGKRSMSQATNRTLMDGPHGNMVPASSRSRALYLPHMVSTLRLLLHYLYTSSLPPLTSPLCTPHTLCSLLQIARPYQVDGLLEATIQRLHEVLDGRNAAAVFNAAAMAAGGGRATGFTSGGTLAELERMESVAATTATEDHSQPQSQLQPHLQLQSQSQSQSQIQTGSTQQLSVRGGAPSRGHHRSSSTDSTSTATSTSQTDTESSAQDSEATSRDQTIGVQAWSGETSSVIGLQKRGLRGLMEGRRLREKATTIAGAEL